MPGRLLGALDTAFNAESVTVGDSLVDTAECPLLDRPAAGYRVGIRDRSRVLTHAPVLFVSSFETGFAAAHSDDGSVELIDVSEADLDDVDVDLIVEINTRPSVLGDEIVEWSRQTCTPLLPAQVTSPFWPPAHDWVLGPLYTDQAGVLPAWVTEADTVATLEVSVPWLADGITGQVMSLEMDEVPNQPGFFFPPDAEAIRQIAERGPEVVVLTGHCRVITGPLRDGGFTGRILVLYPACHADLTEENVTDWWGDRMVVSASSPLGNTDNPIVEEIEAALDEADGGWQWPAEESWRRVGWLYGWYAATLVAAATELNQDDIDPAYRLLAAGRNLDTTHPIYGTPLSTSPASLQPDSSPHLFTHDGTGGVAAEPRWLGLSPVFRPIRIARPPREMRGRCTCDFEGRNPTVGRHWAFRGPCACGSYMRARRIMRSDLRLCVERATGIEPASSAWKAEVLPLNYARGAKSQGTRAAFRSDRGMPRRCRARGSCPCTRARRRPKDHHARGRRVGEHPRRPGCATGRPARRRG